MIETFRTERVSKKIGLSGLFNVNLTLFYGEIMGVLVRDLLFSDTLFKILSAEVQPDFGDIYIDSFKTKLNDGVLQEKGVFCLKKQSQLASEISICENIFYLRQVKGIFTNTKKINKEASSLFQKYGVNNIDLSTPVSRLTVVQRHIIEILILIVQNAKIIIIDNVFDSYSKSDYVNIVEFLKRVTDCGISIMFLINKWDNALFMSATRASIMRSGTIVANFNNLELTKENILTSAAGFSLEMESLSDRKKSDEIILNLVDITCNARRISFCLFKKEILGIYESDYNNCKIVEEVLNARQLCTGKIVVGSSVYKMQESKFKGSYLIGIIPENINSLFFYKMNLMDNITLMIPNQFYKFGIINNRMRKYLLEKSLKSIHSDYIIEESKKGISLFNMDVREQARVLVAKYICSNVRLIAFMNPQNFIDEISIKDFRCLLDDIINNDIGIILISTSESILLNTCSRITSIN